MGSSTFAIRSQKDIICSNNMLIGHTTLDVFAICETKSWKEDPVSDTGSELKISHVRTERTFDGRLKGKGVAEYLMVYHPSEETDPHKKTATYTGLMVFVGSLDDGEQGEATFVTNGTYAGLPVASLTIDPLTATGSLTAIKRPGGYRFSGEAKTMEIWFESDKKGTPRTE